MPGTNEEARQAMDHFIQAYADAMPPSNLDIAFCRAITTTSVSVETDTAPAKATYSFTIPEAYGNNPKVKSVHGSAVAMFFDECSSLIMLAVKRDWGHTGVSRNLNVTFMRPAMMGEKCVIEVEAVQVGRAIATITAVLKRESDGVVLATCQHDKIKPADDRGKYFKL